MVAVPAGEAADVLVDDPDHAVVDAADAPGRVEGGVEIAEDHPVDVEEGAVEAPDGVAAGLRVLLDRVGDVGVRELQEGRPPGAEEDDGVAADAPRDAPGAEEAVRRIRHLGADALELGLGSSRRVTIMERGSYFFGGGGLAAGLGSSAATLFMSNEGGVLGSHSGLKPLASNL